MVCEPMDRAPRDAQRLPRPHLDRHAIDGPGRDPLQPVERLLVGLVTMWERGEPGPGPDGHIEDAALPLDSAPVTRNRIWVTPT